MPVCLQLNYIGVNRFVSCSSTKSQKLLPNRPWVSTCQHPLSHSKSICQQFQMQSMASRLSMTFLKVTEKSPHLISLQEESQMRWSQTLFHLHVLQSSKEPLARFHPLRRDRPTRRQGRGLSSAVLRGVPMDLDVRSCRRRARGTCCMCFGFGATNWEINVDPLWFAFQRFCGRVMVPLHHVLISQHM